MLCEDSRVSVTVSGDCKILYVIIRPISLSICTRLLAIFLFIRTFQSDQAHSMDISGYNWQR